MTDYLKGNTPATIYKQLLGVGGAADHAGLTASLKQVFTDDGSGGANVSSITISTTAMRVETSNQLRFRDDAIYINSSGDGTLNIVADGEVDLASTAIDINATSTLALDNTNTSNGVVINTATSGSPVSIGHSTSETTVNDNLTVTGTTAHTGVATMASGVKLQFVDGNEYLSGNSSDLTIGSSGDINLTASTDVNIPANVGITFGDDGEKIEGDGTNLSVASSGGLNLTGAAASTWKTTAGTILIDSEAAAITVDGHGGVNIAGTNGSEVDITTTGAVDINSGAFTLDGAALSIDGTDDSNFTVTGSGKDVTVAAVGGGAQTAIFSSAGTGADSVQITSSAGGIDIAGASGGDIDITSTGKSVTITSTENATDAIVLSASAGGIDITSAGSAGEDIDISASSSINISSTENAANAIYLHANGGTSETIKIHSDQGTNDASIHLKSDLGSISIQAGITASDKGVLINTIASGGKTYIGHTTSEVYVKDNLTVTGDLTVGGSVPAADTLSAGTIARFTIYNTDDQNAVGARDSEILFKGDNGSGTALELSAITVMQQTEDEFHSKMIFRLNDSTSTVALAATGGADDVLTLTYDKTATFAGAIAAGTNTITGGQVNIDNLRLDGNTISTTDTGGDLIITPNGVGGVTMMNTNAPGNYSFAAGRDANASSTDSVAIGFSSVASGTSSTAIGYDNTASGYGSIVLGYESEATGINSIALGKNAKAIKGSSLAYASGKFADNGDTQGCMGHTFALLTMSSTFQSVNGGMGGMQLSVNDTVCTGTVKVVGATAGVGANTPIGYIISFLVENDGGTSRVVAQSQVAFESEDTSFTCQLTHVSGKFFVQVKDDAVTAAMRWTCFWQWAQQTF